MTDYIERDSVIRTIDAFMRISSPACIGGSKAVFNAAYNAKRDACESIKHIVKDILAVDIALAQKWISVEEILPPNKAPVLASLSFGVTRCEEICIVIGGEWYAWDNGEWDEDSKLTAPVTHWMPLPQPPKEDNNAEKRA